MKNQHIYTGHHTHMDIPISNNLKNLIYTPDMPSIERFISNNKDQGK